MGMADAYADLSGQFNTPLTPEEEARFQQWAQTLPRDLQGTSDYDLRGAWKANAKEAGNGHLPDTWKKPNHATFSNQSMYSTPANGIGGAWESAGLKTAKGDDKYVYWATPANLKYRNTADLSKYFREAEPDNSVVLPINYSLPGGR